MTLRVYNPAVPPPETYEVVGAMAALAEADAGVQALLSALGTVERDAFPNPPDASKPWLRVCIREPWNPFMQENAAKTRWAPYEVVVQASNANDAAWKPRLSISAMHAALYAALAGQKPTLQYAGVVLPIEREGAPTAATYVAEEDLYESIATYRITLKPV